MKLIVINTEGSLMEIIKNKGYGLLVGKISETFIQGRNNAVIAVNQHLVNTYWQIGQYIVEFEQAGNVKAGYGKALLPELSKDSFRSLGKGFSLSNLIRMRQFYIVFQFMRRFRTI